MSDIRTPVFERPVQSSWRGSRLTGRMPVLRRGNGFVLWEMMLALMIFCIVAVSLTRALHQTIDTAVILRDDSQVRRNLQNILAESEAIKLNPGKTDLSIGDGRVRYEREVNRIQPKNDRNQMVANLYQVIARARWSSENQTRTSQAEIVVYQP